MDDGGSTRLHPQLPNIVGEQPRNALNGERRHRIGNLVQKLPRRG